MNMILMHHGYPVAIMPIEQRDPYIGETRSGIASPAQTTAPLLPRCLSPPP